MKIKIIKSPNHSIKNRNKKKIKFIVFHYTGMQSERVAIQRLTSKKSKVSSHYLINRGGVITKMVDEKNIAWHAGKSRWKNLTNLNNQSIGIELVNKGHQSGYENFSKKQILKLVLLSKTLIKKYKIKKTNILGHSDIAPLRKIDPGEKFPWKYLSKKKIGYWYNLDKQENKIYDLDKVNLRNTFFNNLHKIGYRYFETNKRTNKDIMIIKSFQRRFFPSKVTGKIDRKTYIISHFLAGYLKN